MILNFGKVIPPVVQSWAEVMKHVQVNPKCDQNCAVKCLDPMAGCESLYFNQRCLSSCHCKFDIEKMDPATIRHRMDNVTHNVENVNRFFSNVNVENMRLVRPAFDAYLKKASALHEEFGDLLLEHGSKIFGCDESCVSDCLKPEFISFWEIPMCLKDCRCQEGLISIEQVRGEDKDFFGKK